MNFLQKENETNSPKFLWWVLYAFIAVVVCYRLAIVFSYKHELVNGESNNLWNAINVAHEKPVYSNPEALPLEVFQYTPLSQFPVIALAKLLNDQSPKYLYWLTVGGRLFALLLNLLMCWFAYRISTRVYEVKQFWGLLAASWIFVSLTHPNFAIRPDAMLALALFGLFYLFSSALKNLNKRRMLLASAGVGLAILIKQDAFLMMAPFGLILLWNRAWKNLFWCCLVFVFSIGVALMLGHFIFGEFFLYSISKGLQNEASLGQAISVFDKANSLFGFHFTLGVVVAFLLLLFKKSTPEDRLLAFAVISYVIFGFSTSFKLGAWVNYYTMFLCLTPLIVILFIKRSDNFSFSWINSALILLVVINGGIFVFRQSYFYTLPWLRDQQAKKEYYQKYADALAFTRVTHIQPGQYVLTGDQLYRNFLATYSVMPNTEFYSVSQFNYESIRSDEKKSIAYLFHVHNGASVEDFLIHFFRLRKNVYSVFRETPRFTILKINE
jgi:hypothetical protein